MVTQVVTRLLKDLCVTSAKIAAEAVTLAKLGALSNKGDLLGHDGTDHQALAVGTDGQYLVADSASTNGIKWAAFTGLSASSFVFSETPTGDVDGSNANFTLANSPTSGTLRIYVNGMRMNAGTGNDYTLSGTTITFLTGAIPQTGDVILVDYLK